MADPDVWKNHDLSTALNKEKKALQGVLIPLNTVFNGANDCLELLQMAIEEQDQESLISISEDVASFQEMLNAIEFNRMFSGDMDNSNAFLDIQSGSGGTEAQDWAEMLLRMYLRFGESHNLNPVLVEISSGDVAGIKSATIKFSGEFAFGWLRTETGVHRLVRKSPFDSGNRRHTSFASVFVYPEVEDNIEIDINPADLRIDTYRAQGAGGQHVNTTDSAVRITHIPTGIVTQCQAERSQHKNKDSAMKMLKAKMYEAQLLKLNEEKQLAENEKSSISWGSQIRSYVLDRSLIKDLRTGFETGNTQAVLDGTLKPFIEASLKAGVK